MSQFAVLAVPKRRACRFLEMTVVGEETTTLPEDIFTLESAIIGFDVAAFFNGRFAKVYGHALKPRIMQLVKWSFAAIFFILNNNHLS